MIDPGALTPADVGRGVVYMPRVGPWEDGIITSYNERYVFVRYRGSETSKATRPLDLDWLKPVRLGLR
jgi:hypothetical protein